MGELRAAFRHPIRRLAADGALAPPWTVEEAADWCWALAGLHPWEALVDRRGWSRRRHADRLVETFHAVVVAAP